MRQPADHLPSLNIPSVTDLFLNLFRIWPPILQLPPISWPPAERELRVQKSALDVRPVRYAARKPHFLLLTMQADLFPSRPLPNLAPAQSGLRQLYAAHLNSEHHS